VVLGCAFAFEAALGRGVCVVVEEWRRGFTIEARWEARQSSGMLEVMAG
jgi:hypothetical protein